MIFLWETYVEIITSSKLIEIWPFTELL